MDKGGFMVVKEGDAAYKRGVLCLITEGYMAPRKGYSMLGGVSGTLQMIYAYHKV